MTPVRRRAAAGLALLVAAAAAVMIGRRAPGLSEGAPAYRRQGPAGAPVLITEYSDFQCPKCALAQPELKSLMAGYEGKVRLVFRHYPLRMHKWAEPAARAAEAAGMQGKFFEYADRLYAGQKEWSESADPALHFKNYAAALGLDAARFAADWESQKAKDLVETDRAHAQSLSIPATPTFFFNDRTLVGDSQLAAMGVRTMERLLAE